MATIKIILRNKPTNRGLFPIILKIIKDRKIKIISLGLECNKNEWDEGNNCFKKNHANYIQRNRMLHKMAEKALKIIDDFRMENIDFSLDEFEELFRGVKTNQQVKVFDFFDEIIDEMTRAGRIGNAKAYKDTRDSLLKFSPKRSLMFKDINVTFLEKYEVYLRENENTNGGIAFKMRELRAIVNKARIRKIISKELYPFDDYKISKLKSPKNKRALSIDDFKKFKEVDLSERPDLLEAYHYTIFSFYARGINFVDIMKLKWSDIKDGRIYYTRSKTKTQFNIEVTGKLQEILDYYKAQDRPSKYVFPILLSDDLSPTQIANRKHKVISRCNLKLKEIAKLAGIEKNISTYTFRHSFATILKQMGTSTQVISEMMGHSNAQITEVYLKEFESEHLDKENRKLLNL